MIKKLIVILAGMSLAAVSYADVIAAWDTSGVDVADGTGIDEGVSPFRFTAGTLDSNISDAKLSLGAGVTPSTTIDKYGFKVATVDAQTTLAGAIANNHYFEFTFTVAGGFQLDLSSIEMNGEVNGSNAADDVAIMSSIDGYVAGSEIASLANRTSAGTGALDTDGSGWGAPIDLSGAQYQGLTGTHSFRLYGWNTSTGTGSTRLRSLSGDDLVLNGTTSVIPEPSSLAMMGMAAGLLAYLRRRR